MSIKFKISHEPKLHHESLTRPGLLGVLIAQAEPGYTSGLAFQIEECMFQLQAIKNKTKHSRKSNLFSCLQLLDEIPDTARFIKNVLLATRLSKLFQMRLLVQIFR